MRELRPRSGCGASHRRENRRGPTPHSSSSGAKSEVCDMTAHVWPLYERIPVEDFEKTPEPGAIRKFCSEAVNQTVKRIHCERYHDGQLVTYIQADYTVSGRALLLVEAKCGMYEPCQFWVKGSELIEPS